MKTNVKLIDSHCHLQSIDLNEFNQSLQVVLDNAKDNDVVHLLCVCVTQSEVETLRKLAEEFKQVSFSVGVHPTEILAIEPQVEDLIKWSNHSSCIAIGETGLDFYRSNEDSIKQIQRQRFAAHINASNQTKKPLIIHTRAASDDTISLMKSERAEEVGGVMHCFTESWEVAKKALDLNFYISFSGIVTFKSAVDIQEVVKKVPLDRILIETDSPYLAPVPYRGKQNQPAYVKQVAQMIAQLRELNYQTIAEQTTSNFYRCFNLQE
jgi:TatD DNase family protein